MTEITVSLRRPTADGTTEGVEGYLEVVPTRARDVGTDLVLPKPFRVRLGYLNAATEEWVHDGTATITVAPTTEGVWAWRFAGKGLPTWWKHVPDVPTVEFNALDDVDPATLAPTAEPEAAWWLALDDVSGAVTSVDGKTGDVSLSDTYVPLTRTVNGQALSGDITIATGGAVTVDDTPAAPADGTSATYLVTSAVTWPAGLVWSTDPDGGVAPVIANMALVTLFTVGTITRAILAATFPTPPDLIAPTAGTLAASDITHTGFVLTVTGATDETALSGTPYAFSTDNGATYSAWQASASYTTSGLTAETAYTCKHKVRDAGNNETAGTAITVTTSEAPALTGLEGAIMALNPVGYWKLDEAAGTQAADSSGNGRHGTYANTITLAAQNGFVKFGTDGYVEIPDNDAFSMAGSGLTAVALVRPDFWYSDEIVLEKRNVSSAFEYSLKSTKDDTGSGGRRLQTIVWGASGDNTPAATGVTTTQIPAAVWKLLTWSVPNPNTQSTTMYVNDTAQTFTFGSGVTSAANGSAPVKIGDSGLAIGHVALFTGGLTAQQVADLAAAALAEGLIA